MGKLQTKPKNKLKICEKMDDIFTKVREGNAFHVRVWLDNTENDLNQGYVYILVWCVSELTGPDSLVVRASALGAVGRGSRHTKGIKNGTSNSLADARIKRVVLGRY